MLPNELPACDSQDVAKLLEKVIRNGPLAAKVKSIDGHREIDFDRHVDRRSGQCVLHTDEGDIDVGYEVLWLDKSIGYFGVRIVK